MIHMSAKARQAAVASSGEAAMARLADRLAAMAPPLELSPAAIVQPSPAVVAAFATSRAITARAAERARRSRSVAGLIVDGFVSVCSSVPYSAVALALRLVLARLFFLDGQTRVAGPRYSMSVYDFDVSAVLPSHVKAATFDAFLTQYAAVPVPPALGAYLLSYGEFILPVLLVMGMGTRAAAVGLLMMTTIIQIYVMPQAFWTAHVYWASLLLVLISVGPGQISLDALIRRIARR
jgi:putative oxidoreductase